MLEKALKLLHTGDMAPWVPPKSTRRHGFTLVELLATMVVISVLAGFGIPKYHEATKRAKVVRAIGDIRAIQIDLMNIEVEGLPLPADLSGIGRGGMLDPWGNPYVYYPFPPAAGHGNAPPPGARRDRFLVPINTTFDLYSMGPDGASVIALTAAASLDDIVRANDGGFVGEARNF
jgi:general secretion pathway protein G